MTRLHFPERKKVRARVISQHISEAGYAGCVCFSCGNAARALSELVYTVQIAPGADLRAERWWTAAEVHRAFPHLLDATSGHLTIALMNEIALVYRQTLPLIRDVYEVPTGSGETISILRIAFPSSTFRPIYDVGQGTDYHVESPMNNLVKSYEAF